MTFAPIFFELFVLALGMLILLLESFSVKEDRKIFAVIGIIGLAIVFVFLQASAPGPSGMASYVVDSAAMAGGMTTMLADAVAKCRAGVTTVPEVFRVTTIR